MMMLAPEGKNRSWIKVQFLPPNTVNTTAEEVEQNVLPQRLDLPEGKQPEFNAVPSTRQRSSVPQQEGHAEEHRHLCSSSS